MTCDDVFDVLTRGPFPTGAAGDHLVERHLAHCRDCQRLATALQPAVELFQESIGPDESQGLPGYRGRAALPHLHKPQPHDVVLSDEATSFDLPMDRAQPWSRADRAARGGPAPSSKTGRAIRRAQGKSLAPPARGHSAARSNLVRFAAAVLIGVAAAAGSHGLGAWQGAPADKSDERGGGNPQAIALAAHRPVEADRQWLSSLVLPAECRTSGDKSAQESHGHDPLAGLQLASAAGSAALECCTDCHNKTTTGTLQAESRSVVMRACQACH